jgi:hypothetical protein
MRPIPDVIRFGGPHLFVYRTRQEYLSHMNNLAQKPEKFTIDLEKYSWKEKSRQFEEVLQSTL